LRDNQYKRPAINRNCRLRTYYGLAPEEYEALAASQEYKCAICKTPFDGTEHLDHDHSSGWVRGILCKKCNPAIGLFDEDIVRIQEAIEYLISNATPTEFNIFQARERLKRKSRGNKLPRTQEQKDLLRKLRIGTPAWNRGKVWDTKTKEKMRESANNRWASVTQEQMDSYIESGRKSASARWESEG
jgi:DNA-directed RNA polymerase subunit RPC12/RpoP